MGNRTTWRFLCGSLVAVLLGLSLNAAAQPAGPRWVTAWATSQQDLGPDGVSNATVRMIARVTAAGESVRIRLDNTYGREPLELGAAAVGQPMRGAWMRDEAEFDGLLDFDAVMRRADDADLLEAAFDCDGIHPNVLGYYEMGRSIPLDLFAP